MKKDKSSPHDGVKRSSLKRRHDDVELQELERRRDTGVPRETQKQERNREDGIEQKQMDNDRGRGKAVTKKRRRDGNSEQECGGERGESSKQAENHKSDGRQEAVTQQQERKRVNGRSGEAQSPEHKHKDRGCGDEQKQKVYDKDRGRAQEQKQERKRDDGGNGETKKQKRKRENGGHRKAEAQERKRQDESIGEERKQKQKQKQKQKHKQKQKCDGGGRGETQRLQLDRQVDRGNEEEAAKVMLAKERFDNMQLLAGRIALLGNKLVRAEKRLAKAEQRLREANDHAKPKVGEANNGGTSSGPELGRSSSKAVADGTDEKAKKTKKKKSVEKVTSESINGARKLKSTLTEEVPIAESKGTKRVSRKPSGKMKNVLTKHTKGSNLLSKTKSKDIEDAEGLLEKNSQAAGKASTKGSAGSKRLPKKVFERIEGSSAKETEDSGRSLKEGAEGVGMTECEDSERRSKKKPKCAEGVSNKKSEGGEEVAMITKKVSKVVPEPSFAKKAASKRATNSAGRKVQPEVAKPDLISFIKTKDHISPVSVDSTLYFKTTHMKKMRSIVLNPSSQTQFATSALDGHINLWQLDPRSHGITSSYKVDVSSEGRPAECIAWHPDGQRLFGVYNADHGLPQVFMMKNDENERDVILMRDKPHIKGAIKRIDFMPWDSPTFATAGSDHMVTLWRANEGNVDAWKSNVIHGNIHTSVVSAVAGSRSRHLVLTGGLDKRVVGFDPAARRVAFHIDASAPCHAVLPNPVDFNLLMVGTSQPSQQLSLYDMRVPSRLHLFGWQQDKSNSPYIMQSWSTNGYYLASGSRDSNISIFDIRYNGSGPVKTMKAHDEGPIFAAIWHPSLHVLLSISLDRKIGLHKLSKV